MSINVQRIAQGLLNQEEWAAKQAFEIYHSGTINPASVNGQMFQRAWRQIQGIVIAGLRGCPPVGGAPAGRQFLTMLGMSNNPANKARGGINPWTFTASLGPGQPAWARSFPRGGCRHGAVMLPPRRRMEHSQPYPSVRQNVADPHAMYPEATYHSPAPPPAIMRPAPIWSSQAGSPQATVVERVQALPPPMTVVEMVGQPMGPSFVPQGRTWSAPATPAPVTVIQRGLGEMKRRAWELARKALSGDPQAVAKMIELRKRATAGDWMARQFLTMVQSAIQQLGGDVRIARWSGESASVTTDMQQDMQNAVSLVNRARRGDQNAAATLRIAHQGNARARRMAGYAARYMQTGAASFGASKSHGSVKSVHRPTVTRHPAITAAKLQGIRVAPSAVAVRVSTSPTRPSPTSAHRRSGGHSSGHSGRSSGGSSGGGSSGGGSSGGGSGSGDTNGDQGLDDQTGQQQFPEIVKLVDKARAGDQNANRQLRSIMRAMRGGDPRYQEAGKAILQITGGKPEFGEEMLNGHAVNLSHSHPLTSRRLRNIEQDILGTHGPSGVQEFRAYVQAPHGQPSGSIPAWTGQVVGRAQALQAARFPGAPIRLVSTKAAREVGE
jgi:uncharacterized membrane protein YgcG